MAEMISGKVGQEIARATGLSPQDFGILMQLDRMENGKCRQREIQDFLEWDKSRLSHQLTRMTSRGLVVREVAGSAVTISMTEEGRRLLDSAKPVHAASVRANFIEHLSAQELEQLRSITGKLRSALAGSDA